jgi:hypothetical protein
MRTRPGFDEDKRVRVYRARLAVPRIISIDGASSYWLEAAAGRRISEEYPSSAAPLAAVLVAVAEGSSIDEVVLVCRLADGDRYEIGSGGGLYDAALSAAGLPPARLGRPDKKAAS